MAPCCTLHLLSPSTSTSPRRTRSASRTSQPSAPLHSTGTASTSRRTRTTPTSATAPVGCRLSYAHPVQLRDNVTGEVISFTTSFSFAITVTDLNNKGDGMAFFLGSYSYPPEPPGSGGGALGLCTDCADVNKIAAGRERFVAVEFDTYNNMWDPNLTYDHMGIDVNSVVSVANVSLPDFSLNGSLSARVDYNGSTGVMSAELRFNYSSLFDGATAIFNLSAKVDLGTVLPDQVAIGFSAATGNSIELHQLLSWSFSTIPTTSTSSSSPPSSPSRSSSSSNLGLKLALGITSASSLFFCLAVLALIRALRRKISALSEIELESEARNKSMDEEFQKGSGPKRFEYMQLAAATMDFSEEEKLGEGGFGSVYRGYLKELDLHVAIKRVSRRSDQGRKEYSAEVKIISRLRHRNLVQLIGWCHQGRELLLVYELMPRGSLDTHLYNHSVLLTWPVRFKIVLGLGHALLYLHRDWEQCVVHRDVKPSNIMLDASFDAKLGDFGLARFVDHGRGARTTTLAGTMGYMDPECLVTGRAGPESDVYSFGVVLLEVACGRPPVFPSSSSKKDDDKEEEEQGWTRLVEWIWSLYGRGAVLEATDERLAGDFDRGEMERVMVVGLACAHPDSSVRPSIRQAVTTRKSLKNVGHRLPKRILAQEISTARAPASSTLRRRRPPRRGGAACSPPSPLTTTSTTRLHPPLSVADYLDPGRLPPRPLSSPSTTTSTRRLSPSLSVDDHLSAGRLPPVRRRLLSEPSTTRLVQPARPTVP